MKKRRANCWLMQRKMVTPVATISAQRHTPDKVRTRRVSASAGPIWCGSLNTIRAAWSVMLPPCGEGLFEDHVHPGLAESGRAGLHPALGERLVVRRRGGAVGLPGVDHHLLALDQPVIVLLGCVVPGALFLERADGAVVIGDDPLEVLQRQRHAFGAWCAVLVAVEGVDHGLSHGIDRVGRTV